MAEEPDRDARLHEAIAAYYQAIEEGQSVDRTAFLARYPDLAGELAAFLDDKDAFERRAGGAAAPPLDATLAHEAAAFAASPARPPTPPTTSDLDDRLRAPAGAAENGAATPPNVGAAIPSGHLSVGCYEVLDILGRGGMGVVYRARHLKLGRVAALKMLLGGEFSDPEERARFQREAEAAARLAHPNIVQVYEVGRYEPAPGAARPYFTLE